LQEGVTVVVQQFAGVGNVVCPEGGDHLFVGLVVACDAIAQLRQQGFVCIVADYRLVRLQIALHFIVVALVSSENAVLAGGAVRRHQAQQRSALLHEVEAGGAQQFDARYHIFCNDSGFIINAAQLDERDQQDGGKCHNGNNSLQLQAGRDFHVYL